MDQATPSANDQFSQFQDPPKKKAGCFSIRNIVLGCFGSILLCGGFGAATMFGAMSIMKTSGAYTQAVATAKANPDVQKKIGTPMTEGFFTTGNVSTTNNTGNADLSIPVSGPNGSGTLHAVGTLNNGKWTYSVLDIEVGGEHIDLLNAEKY
ncbi:MAG: cytochrome c oxidase assembly factor Coa1 family protein [Planctomycetota bacterium]